MPRMDGIKATKEIRKRWPSESGPFIIGMTAHALDEDREAALAAGMDRYIAKPVTLEKLTAVLEEITARLEQTSGERPSASTAIDQERLSNLRRTIGEKQVEELVDDCLVDAGELIERIEAAARHGDVEDRRKAAHL